MPGAGVIVLTNCTNRKREPAPRFLRASSLPSGSLAQVSNEWVKRVRGARRSFCARELYCGRVVTECRVAGEVLGAKLVFVSAGLGIVEDEQRVPAYSLTTTEGHRDSIGSRIVEPFDPHAWWRALANAQGRDRPLAGFLEREGASLVIVAMPATYLAMFAPELAELSARRRGSLRIIGPRRAEDVHEGLRPYWLPYDSRLDSPESGINGTASDFPHRALRHFAQCIAPKGKGGDIRAHAEEVKRSLSGFKAYVRPRGRSAPDAQILSEITALWGKHDGRRASILRELRSVRHIACEQSRFRVLADEVKAKRYASE